MSKGIVRKLDELGRITLPIEIRRSLGITASNHLGINLDGGVIRISKHVTGMSRPLDELGRVVVPKEIRTSMSFIDNQPVDIWVEDGEICLAKNGCEWCSATEDLFTTEGGHKLCRKCAYTVIDVVLKEN